MKKIFLIAFVSFLPLFAKAANDNLWINQIQITGGPGQATNDFIEIYNPTSSDIDLQGMRLVKRSVTGTTDTLIKSWSESTIVKAGGFYLWANSNYSSISVTPDITNSGSIADNNAVALRNGASDTGTIIDSVGWGEAANSFVEGAVFATNPEANRVLLRTQDTENNSVDFILADPNPRNSLSVSSSSPPPSPNPIPEPSLSPAPTPEPSQPQPVPSPSPTLTPPPSFQEFSRTIVISEFMPNPDGPDNGEEWIELHNTSAYEVDISNWQLDDEVPTSGGIGSSAYKIAVNQKVQPGAYFLILLPESVFALNNTGGDSLRLFWPNGELVNEVKYEGAAKEDVTYARTAEGTYVWTNTPTKGLANSFAIEEKVISVKQEPTKEVEEQNPATTKTGEVAGLTELPRTGDNSFISMNTAFVLWTILWYIYVRLSKKGDEAYEQTRTD